MNKAITWSISGAFAITTIVSSIALHTLYTEGKAFAPEYPRFAMELNNWSSSKLIRLYKSLSCPTNNVAKCKLITGRKKLAEDREWREALDAVYRKIRSTSEK